MFPYHGIAVVSFETELSNVPSQVVTIACILWELNKVSKQHGVYHKNNMWSKTAHVLFEVYPQIRCRLPHKLIQPEFVQTLIIW